jgi:hypothetical protein
MSTLRLTQSIVKPQRFRVEAVLEGDGLPRQVATTEFDFVVPPQDREDLRWYLEDYLLHTADPAQEIAARIEKRIKETGVELFEAIFQTNDDVRNMWAALQENLNDTRVEIITGGRDSTALPWELLRDPKTDMPLALSTSAFVRGSHQNAQEAHLPQGGTKPIRILLVICRPGGGDDVPFRSVANRLIKGLSGSAREAFQLDVLRPPTFAQLEKVLRAAKTDGKPYHVVHFDGHGMYEDPQAKYANEIPKNWRGYLVFENPTHQAQTELVHGTVLGEILSEFDVPVLVLNACRSGSAETPAKPVSLAELLEQGSAHSAAANSAPRKNVDSAERAFGSLAQEVINTGVAGVVAMRYNVYVATAAQFMANLYSSLVRGQALGEAVTWGRKQLDAQPLREIVYQSRPLQDWIVPIVHEAATVTLFPKPPQKPELGITISVSVTASSRGGLAPELEKQPDVGFFGRDETLLALDRVFDRDKVALLHGYAGSGKTSTAVEFARWYKLTGGVAGPVLFTSFEQHKSLVRILDEAIPCTFGNELEKSGVRWLTLVNDQRRDMALKMITENPVLWIWDSIEQIAGFPAGAKSAWSDPEQRALLDFLSAAKTTKAKFLLTSRRQDQSWLGDLPVRISVPDMNKQDTIELARAIAEKYGRQLGNIDDWVPLLYLTQGNPLTIAVLIGQALRERLKTKAEIETFVSRLRNGEVMFADQPGEGRDKSLSASLNYGFEHAFNEAERKQLALLHLFQGFINIRSLLSMGHPGFSWCLPELRTLTLDEAFALLDRAAEIGWLIPAEEEGNWWIHPALSVHLKGLFNQFYAQDETRVLLAFVESVAAMSKFCVRRYDLGHRDAALILTKEERNLLFALQVSKKFLWKKHLIAAAQALRLLYCGLKNVDGRIEWRRLVDEITPELIDPRTGGPLASLENEWLLLMDYRVEVTQDAGLLAEAERLQNSMQGWLQTSLATLIANPTEDATELERYRLSFFVRGVMKLGGLQLQQHKPEGFASSEAAFELMVMMGRETDAASCALNLASAYTMIPERRDPVKAEFWCRKCLGFLDQEDSRRGSVYLLVLYLSKLYDKPGLSTLCTSLANENPMVRSYHDKHDPKSQDPLLTFEQLGKFPLPPVTDPRQRINALRVRGHCRIVVADMGGVTDFQEAVQLAESIGDSGLIAQLQLQLAQDLLERKRLADAKIYALAAVRNFKTLGNCAIQEIKKAQKVITSIGRLQAQGS